MDAYKISLGLPPDLPIDIKDPLLDRFILIDKSLTDLQDEVAEALRVIRKGRAEPNTETMKDQLLIVQELDPKIKDQLDLVAASLNQLIERIPARLKQLELVAEQVEDLEADVDPRVYDQEQFNARVEFLRQRVPQINREFTETHRRRETWLSNLATTEPAAAHRNSLT